MDGQARRFLAILGWCAAATSGLALFFLAGAVVVRGMVFGLTWLGLSKGVAAATTAVVFPVLTASAAAGLLQARHDPTHS